MASVGAMVSITSDWVTVAGLPAASVAVTLTAFVPLVLSDSVPLGTAVAVSTLQTPPVATVV